MAEAAQSSSSEPPQHPDVFTGFLDRYHGVTVDSLKERCSNIEHFTTKLQTSLQVWQERGDVRGVWFKVALRDADLVPILAKNEFWFHHTKPDYVMMCRWLPKNVPCAIPNYAHTMFGVGGLVVDNYNRLLVVKERFWRTPFWKLPGGFLEQGEDIGSGAVREVFEETGILTEFSSIVALRHHHASQFGCSDVYVVVHLTPLVEGQPIQRCTREIQECIWMDIDEFFQHPEAHKLNRFFVRKYLENAARGTAMTASKSRHPIFKNPQTVYTVNCESSVRVKDPDHKWTVARGGKIPPDAFPAGVDHKERGMFICSALINGEQTPGKVVPAHDSAMVPSGGKEHWISEYHVLCGTDQQFKWLKTDGGKPIPMGAVTGGVALDGEPMYIGRVQINGADTIGKVLKSQSKCYVPYAHEERSHYNFEILIDRQKHEHY